jgi:hypothetical protein
MKDGNYPLPFLSWEKAISSYYTEPIAFFSPVRFITNSEVFLPIDSNSYNA